MKHVSYRARAHLPRLRTRTIMALNIENTILNVSNHHEIEMRLSKQAKLYTFRRTPGGIMTHLFSMVSFFVYTCPNRPGVGAIDNPD